MIAYSLSHIYTPKEIKIQHNPTETYAILSTIISLN